MNLIDIYFQSIRKNSDNPQLIRKLIQTGINYEILRLSLYKNSKYPKALTYLNRLCLKYLKDSLYTDKEYAWVNLFAPTEFLHAAGIKPLFIEGFSGISTGFGIEDICIDEAENLGISDTLCSFHRLFIGAVEKGYIRKPSFAITSSMICDANINTFKYLTEKLNIPLYIIDIPYEYNKDSVNYVEIQLEEMINFIENNTDKKIENRVLKEVINKENQCRKLLLSSLKSLKEYEYPNTMMHEMFMMYASHVYIGDDKTLKFFKLLHEDIKKYKKTTSKKRLLWIHTMPFAFNPYKELFDLNDNIEIIGMDFNYDWFNMLDENYPVLSIAEKMTNNPYNGCLSKRIKHLLKLADITEPDAVVNFCHWGCKQASGGVYLLKEAFAKRGIPFITVDGDCLDNRNNQEGQLKTRMEAFLEII